MMSGHISNEIKKNRARKLIEIDEDLQLSYNKKFVGKKVSVLIEEIVNGKSIGHTQNFLKVIVDDILENNVCYDVLIKAAFPEYVEAIKEEN